MATFLDLQRAVLDGDLQAFEDLLESDPSTVEAEDALRETLLHLACWAKRPLMTSTLLHERASVNVAGMVGLTPLHYAVRAGGFHVPAQVWDLRRSGASRTVRDAYGLLPWDWALMAAKAPPAYVAEKLAGPSEYDHRGEGPPCRPGEVQSALAATLERDTAEIDWEAPATDIGAIFEKRLFEEFLRDQLIVELSHMLLRPVAEEPQALGRLLEELEAASDAEETATLGEWCARVASALQTEARDANEGTDGD